MAGQKAESEREPAKGKKPAPEPEVPSSEEPDGEPAPGEAVSVLEELKILKAMAFYRQALKDGPRLACEVLAEGKRQGHAKRTQERARSRLNVQKIPPTTWQGNWKIALPGDQAVEAAKQHRKEKEQKRQHQQGNGRKKPKGGGGSQTTGEMLAVTR